MNHHLGMTVTIDFRQPLNGQINTGAANNDPMTFQFSGDDDVWIFIDDVLVLDLGGIHSEIYGTIDFSTGEVFVGQSWKTNGFPYKADGTVDLEKLYQDAPPTQSTNLKQQFENAKRADTTLWKGNTFASNTSHTLKMFYLERGNYDSSLALRFNLQSPLYQQVKKVDQEGNPLEGVEFDLCPAERTTDPAGAIRCLYTDNAAQGTQEFYVKQAEGSAFVHLTTASDGSARFLDENGNYFNFADRGDAYYILKETRTPPGYRTLPVELVLHYDPNTAMLSVANRWTTGAYACSLVHVAGTGSLNYGSFDLTSGDVTPVSQAVSRDKQRDGLIVAVPLLLQKSDNTWEPLYGSNLGGFTVSQAPQNPNALEWQSSVLGAALEQAADDKYPNWQLIWDEDNLRLTGTLSDLPGLANRYLLNNAAGDLQMLYGIIEPEALEALGIHEGDAQARYGALGRYVKEHGTQATLQRILGTSVTGTESGNGFSFLNPQQFSRDFRSLIYVPNEQRELWVMKIDQDGKLCNGAQFGLYTDASCSGTPVAQGTTATVNGQEGTLIFSPANDNSPGHAQIGWATERRSRYYLREMAVPEGCTMNNTVIPVVVGTYSVYADAGTEADGVSVMAGVGRLTQTMRQFAMSDDVDITLRDITAFEQRQPSENTEVLPGDWTDVMLAGTTNVQRSMNLHFGRNTIVDYGLHNEDGGMLYKPYFVADTGFIRARIQQNWAGLNGQYEGAVNDANKDNLEGVDITNLFSLLNVVVVTDQTTQDTNTGRLVLQKMLSGEDLTEADYTRNFTFTIELTDEEGHPLSGNYYFYGTNKAGYLSSGQKFPLHHDEQINILGLPAGTKFTVTEEDDSGEGWYVLPEDGSVSEEIIKDASSFAPFFNSKQPWGDMGVLIIHKAVAGSGDRTRDFTFTVTFQDADGEELEDLFHYTGDKSGDISSGDSVTLHHDQHILIFVPVGTQYSIVEKEANQDGYTFTARGEKGTIEDKEVYTAVFINRKEEELPEDPGSGQEPGSSSSPGQPGVRIHAADSGDPAPLGSLLAVFLLSGIGMLFLILGKLSGNGFAKWREKKRR